MNPNIGGLVEHYGSGYGYSEETELEVAKSYRDGVGSIDTSISECRVLYSHIIDTVSSIISREKSSCVVNFGVSYAYVDSILAKMFPKTRFVCVDRSEGVRKLNVADFEEIINMEFVAGDIFDVLNDLMFSDCILLTSRTLTLLPRDFILRLWIKAKESGVKYIIGMEPTGNCEIGTYYFSDAMKPSVLYRGQMFIHNYPALLKESGYRVKSLDLIKTGHPHKDFRIVSFIGER